MCINLKDEENSLNVVTKEDEIVNLIYTIRGKQVMLDSDVANLYHYETKRINETVNRNKSRFPESFCFQLTKEEYEEVLRSQNSTLENRPSEKFNNEYPRLNLVATNMFHDRFIIIDNSELYHLGASIKDLGKKCFGISKMLDKVVLNNIQKEISKAS